ncbi:hypothetical protein PILCRDRAFT_429681 [Piloderma croceum F 1598]|uniref:Uncharacterized protein n=1 Tax=Piloderma croceum (strain F 1598) TaxID=765440 RepID=A0A0C3BBA9_PILCF|nr:hypothetical protein PILCRDRAFT_429681 [Piloderma croceum F 1598]
MIAALYGRASWPPKCASDSDHSVEVRRCGDQNRYRSKNETTERYKSLLLERSTVDGKKSPMAGEDRSVRFPRGSTHELEVGFVALRLNSLYHQHHTVRG